MTSARDRARVRRRLRARVHARRLDDLPQGPPFSLEAVRNAAEFTGDIEAALRQAGVEPETVEPEYGYSPVRGHDLARDRLDGGRPGDHHARTDPRDRASARPRGRHSAPSRASTASATAPTSTSASSTPNGGNGAYDPDGDRRRQRGRPAVHRGRAAPHAGDDRAGRPEPGLVLPPRPAPLELRLRELRHPEPRGRDPDLPVAESRSREGRARLQHGASAARRERQPVHGHRRAGARGARGDPRRTAAAGRLDRDPADLSDDERAALGIVPLPGSRSTEALEALDSDERARAWLPPVMYESYVAVKRAEIALADPLDPADDLPPLPRRVLAPNRRGRPTAPASFDAPDGHTVCTGVMPSAGRRLMERPEVHVLGDPQDIPDRDVLIDAGPMNPEPAWPDRPMCALRAGGRHESRRRRQRQAHLAIMVQLEGQSVCDRHDPQGQASSAGSYSSNTLPAENVRVPTSRNATAPSSDDHIALP